jgi:hypothetical protein
MFRLGAYDKGEAKRKRKEGARGGKGGCIVEENSPPSGPQKFFSTRKGLSLKTLEKSRKGNDEKPLMGRKLMGTTKDG